MQFGEVIKIQDYEVSIKVPTWFSCVTLDKGLNIARLQLLICKAGEIIVPIPQGCLKDHMRKMITAFITITNTQKSSINVWDYTLYINQPRA